MANSLAAQSAYNNKVKEPRYLKSKATSGQSMNKSTLYIIMGPIEIFN